ncbi:MAG: SpvB/TcaC N-terminal domain-containing protein [Gemmatimonadaceae bacterium]
MLALDIQGQRHDVVRQDHGFENRRSRRSAQSLPWLICESYDDKGNAIVYDYVAEDSRNVDPSRAGERNRTEASRSANRYLKRIRYGNKVSRLVEPDLTKLEWHFQVVFDYEEGHLSPSSPDGADPVYVAAWADRAVPLAWPTRRDAFSSYRACFEVRTYRLCRRVLVFHEFDSLGSTPCLVRSTEFSYDESPVASFISSVVQSGYVRERKAVGAFTDRYRKKSLPPLEFTYSKVPDGAALAGLPVKRSMPQAWRTFQRGWMERSTSGWTWTARESQAS